MIRRGGEGLAGQTTTIIVSTDFHNYSLVFSMQCYVKHNLISIAGAHEPTKVAKERVTTVPSNTNCILKQLASIEVVTRIMDG